MSTFGNLSGVRFSGLASGIDTDSIIQQLAAIEAQPIQRMQAQQAQLQARMSVYLALRSQVQGVKDAMSGLNSAAAFNPVKTSTSVESAATISATTDALPGVYRLAISKLAQAHKIASSQQADATSALNLTASSIVVNGKGVSVTASDSLTSLAQKINAAGAGASATVVNGGTGNVYLMLTATGTGAKSELQLADVGAGDALQTLGLISGVATIREPITNGAKSISFSSATASFDSLTGLTLPGGTVGIGSGSVAITGSDTLTSLAAKINDPVNGTGATATVNSETVDGKTRYWLEVTGPSTPAFADAGNTLQTLGILQRAYTSEVAAAQDAAFTLDGVAMTSPSNTLDKVVPGATIKLLDADLGDPIQVDLTIERDESKIGESVQKLADSFNSLIDFVRKNSKFDATSFSSGPLFGDPIASQIEGELAGLLFNTYGSSGQYTNLGQLGFSMDDQGKLQIDSSVLDAAIAADPAAVGSLFRATGSAVGEDLSFVSNTSKSKSSQTGGFEVLITQAATKGVFQASESIDGTVTFSGSLFGSTPYNLLLGTDVDANVAKINSDARLKDLMVAENSGGFLKLTSKRFGAAGNFVVTGLQGSVTDGLDVAGTIGGEEATGSGQYLTGNGGNANTDGLQILYKGTATGSVGFVKLTLGAAAAGYALAEGYTDGVSGLLTANDQSLQSQYDDIGKSITSLQERLALSTQTLRERFQAMEAAIQSLQSQQQRLSQILKGAG